MTIAAKLLQINGVKEDIRDAIESFGYDLSNVPFTEYAEWIAILGSETSITPTASAGNGNISDDLDELANVKADIKNAIESKGISLTNVPFTEYAQYIYQIPVVEPKPFGITMLQNGSIGWIGTFPNLQYSKNGGTWTNFTTSLTNLVTGDYVEFRNNGTTWVASSNNSHFSISSNCYLSGNIMSLVDSTLETTEIDIDSCFMYLFSGCGIVDASNLILADNTTFECYRSMFYNCTSLTGAPYLPAMELLDEACYQAMFMGCSSLVDPPELPAETITDSCYYNMFRNCTSLTTAPNLPATTIADYCYSGMFAGCTSLVTAMDTLPGEKMYRGCYYQMFEGCTALETAPEILAVYDSNILSTRCFDRMFRNCSSLTTAPDLPSLACPIEGYNQMFEGCTALETAPELPATLLGSDCYNSMFKGCTSLINAPSILPDTDLKWSTNCYDSMFYGCTALETAPVLPASTLETGCYNNMFYGCSSLNYIEAIFSNDPTDGTYTQNWVNGVAQSGTFVKNGAASWTCVGNNGVPTGWTIESLVAVSAVSSDTSIGTVTGGGIVEIGDTVTLTANPKYPHKFVNWTVNGVEVSTSPTYSFTVSEPVEVIGNFKKTDPLTFTSKANNSTIDWTNSTYPNLEYSKNGGTWTAFNGTITADENDTVEFRNNGSSWTSTFNDKCFTTTGTFDLSGNIMSLIDKDMLSTALGITYTFTFLFTGCGIVDASQLILPSMWLENYCYSGMFENCTSLTAAPELPADASANSRLAISCYQQMFYGCTSLTTAPNLPATTIAKWCYRCYNNMFHGCTSLTTAPNLPATTIADYCYSGMFENCTSLTAAPELPATTLAQGCYLGMFAGCSSLNYIKCLATDISATDCTSDWVQNVSATGTFVKDSSMSDWTTGDNGIPSGWTVQNA